MASASRLARDRRLELLRHRIASDRARHALALVLYEALADGLELGPRDPASRVDREWFRGAMAVPLQEAADAALDALVWRMALVLDGAPEGLGGSFDRDRDPTA